MVRIALHSEAPQDIVALAREVHGLIAFGVVAETTRADRLTATIVIRNEVVLTVDRIVTGANPRYGRRLSTWRTTVHAATATRA